MSRDNFQQFILKYPAISLKVLSEFSKRLAKTEKQAANIAMETAETRIAMYLAEIADETMRNTENASIIITSFPHKMERED
nr:hypothetical protein [Sporosarcina jiandibaonis]